MSKISGSRPLVTLACSAMLALAAVPSHPATVLSVGTIDLVEGCDFIFQGTPIERWVAAGATPGTIFTNVRFTVSEVLKGDPERASVVLGYLGGTLDGVTLSIEGLRLPGIGEEGIYFVERLERSQVHPLFGWEQGLFRVIADSQGNRNVFTNDLRPVARIDGARAPWGISSGPSAGVVIAETSAAAMSVEAFKASIRELVGEQK